MNNYRNVMKFLKARKCDSLTIKNILLNEKTYEGFLRRVKRAHIVVPEKLQIAIEKEYPEFIKPDVPGV